MERFSKVKIVEGNHSESDQNREETPGNIKPIRNTNNNENDGEEDSGI